jgi:histidinol-phosphate aminotransferase
MKFSPHVPRSRVPVLDKPLLLHRNTRPEPYPPEMAEAMGQAAAGALHAYPDLSLLQRKIAEMNGVDEDMVLLTSGVDGAIKTVFETCVQPGDTVAYLWPTYMMYDIYTQAFGAKVQRILPLRLDGRCYPTVPVTASVTFIANPSAPIVDSFSADEMRRVCVGIRANAGLLMFDEAYHGFGAETAIPLVRQFNNVLVARSFSKAWGLPNIRVGYLIGNKDLIARLASKRHAYEVSGPGAAVALWAMENPGEFKAYMYLVVAMRKFARQAVDGMGLNVHGDKSNSLLIEFASPAEAASVADLLFDCGVVVRRNIPTAEQCIGVTIGQRGTMEQFLLVLERCLFTFRNASAKASPWPAP